MLTQARYLGLDWRTKTSEGAQMHVVLLHGLYASAGVFRPLKRELSDRFDVAFSSFSYLPGSGIEALSRRLEILLASLSEPAPILLVGHSLGGLVMRYYVRGPNLDARVVHTISLAAPFRGSMRHRFVPGQAGRDIDPTSPILELLRRDDEVSRRIAHLTLVAEDDELIEPDAYPEYGEAQLIFGAGHNGILFCQGAISAVVERVQRCLAVYESRADHFRSS